MQKYEKPFMELEEDDVKDIVTLSVGQGDGPVVDDGSWTN